MGYLANNREGLSINTEFKLGDLVVSAGAGFYYELERTNNKFSFSHNNTTGLILSRISYFSSGYGPYAQLNSYYRGVFEEVNVGNRYALDTTYWDEDINDSITGNLEFTNENPFFDKFYCSSGLTFKI